MTGISKNTVVKLLADIGAVCQAAHDKYVVNLRTQRVQVDEIWSFCGAKIALHFMHYNFCRVHQTLRVTPAMEAGLTDRAWELSDLADLLEYSEQKLIEGGSMKRGPYKAKED
jgi:hypothetical protein